MRKYLTSPNGQSVYRYACWEKWLLFHFSTNGGQNIWNINVAAFFNFTALFSQ
jgi:hypothetical protein